MVAGQNYRDLMAWQKAMDLVEVVYTLTAAFPSEERYGLSSQVRRAAVSVPSNIAEGQGRRSPGELAHFLAIAHGSLREVETQLMIAARLRFIGVDACEAALAATGEVGRLITGLIRSLERRQ